MPFYETGDDFVTASKIPVKTSLKQLAKVKMFFKLFFFFLLQWCAKHTQIKKYMKFIPQTEVYRYLCNKT